MKSEKLKNAEVKMLVASIDYDDNFGSNNRMEFWERFEQARTNYILIRDKEKNEDNNSR